MADVATGKLDIGKVISGTFKVVGADPFNFFIITAGFTVLPSIALALVRISSGGSPTAFALNPLFWLVTLAAVVAGLVGYGALVWLSGEIIAGHRAKAMDAVRAGLPRALPLVGLLVLQSLAMLVGFTLLLVPGVMMALAWSVALPALVLDRAKVFEAFSQSARLTKGNRWRILGLMAIYFLALFVVFAVGGAASAAAVLLGPALGVGFAGIVVGPLLNLLTYPFTNAGLTVLYAELRDLKDGVGPESLAKVFD